MDFERYTDERVHMLKVRAMGQLLIIVFALVVLIKTPMFDIYCVRVPGYSMEASFHYGSEYLMKKSGYTLERGDVVKDTRKIGKRVVTYNCIKEIPAYYYKDIIDIKKVSGEIVRLRYLQDVADLMKNPYVFALVKDKVKNQIEYEDKTNSNICLLKVLNLTEDGRTYKREAYCLEKNLPIESVQ